jgi:hypothetical protein
MFKKVRFESDIARLTQFAVKAKRDEAKGKLQVERLELDGRPLAPTRRFWTSLFQRFGVAEGIFRYFEPAEVFARIAERSKDESVRICIERPNKGPERLLAVAAPDRPPMPAERLVEIVKRHGGDDVQYHEGIVTSRHLPRCGAAEFEIGVDRFEHRFVLETPLDGFGGPKIHLSFLRMLCSNGAVGYARAFRSEIATGRDPLPAIERALEGFDAGDGFAGLKQRFESSQRSWASVRECESLYRLLVKMQGRGELAGEVLRQLGGVTGNLAEIYGMANLDGLTEKRQRLLPARCRAYDLVNFASELATHKAAPAGARLLQGWIGELVADEFDLEGTADQATEFADFLAGGPDVDPLRN